MPGLKITGFKDRAALGAFAKLRPKAGRSTVGLDEVVKGIEGLPKGTQISEVSLRSDILVAYGMIKKRKVYLFDLTSNSFVESTSPEATGVSKETAKKAATRAIDAAVEAKLLVEQKDGSYTRT